MAGGDGRQGLFVEIDVCAGDAGDVVGRAVAGAEEGVKQGGGALGAELAAGDAVGVRRAGVVVEVAGGDEEYDRLVESHLAVNGVEQAFQVAVQAQVGVHEFEAVVTVLGLCVGGQGVADVEHVDGPLSVARLEFGDVL